MEIYLDYAATSPLKPQVLEAMMPYLTGKFGNADSLHTFGREAAYAVTSSRDRIAALLGVTPSEVYFTSGGTEADNWAVRRMGSGSALLSPIEHAAALSALPLRAKRGRTCAVSSGGIVRPEHLSAALREGTGLICVMAVNNETGCIQPVAELASFAHERGALFFSDCVQAACTLDLKEILRHADAISLSAHKIGGPKGVGALIVKRGVKLSPLLVGGEQERSLRGGTLNVAGIVGFAKALELAQGGREAFCAHTGRLRDLFEQKVCSTLGEEVKVDGENRAPNISHLTFARGGEAFLNVLDLHGVAASGGAACSAHAALPSHVMTAMGKTAEESRRGIRFSFGEETTEEETKTAAEKISSQIS